MYLLGPLFFIFKSMVLVTLSYSLLISDNRYLVSFPIIAWNNSEELGILSRISIRAQII